MHDEYAEVERRIDYLERREAELAHEEQSLPKAGRLASAWRKVSNELRVTRRLLQEAREDLLFLTRNEDDKEQILSDVPPAERAYIEEMLGQYEAEHPTSTLKEVKARRWREEEAERRRDSFRVIEGGRS